MRNGSNGTYTLRASVPSRTTTRFQLDNGDFNSGFKVVGLEIFQIAGSDVSDVVLHTNDADTAVAVIPPDFENNRQIAWGAVTSAARGLGRNIIIDPNHVIVNDLYISNNDSASQIEVLIVLRKKEISDSENILYQIKERAQGNLQ